MTQPRLLRITTMLVLAAIAGCGSGPGASGTGASSEGAKKTSYTLTIATNGSGTTNPAAGTYTVLAGSTDTVTATPADGYTFTGWSGAATGTANPVTITVNADTTLTASFATGGTAGDPFGCRFAWGEPVPDGSLTGYTWLQFMTSWLGWEIRADGTAASFGQTDFLQRMAATGMVPAYYAYLLGFYGHANGLPDGNLSSPGQPDLTTGLSYLVLSDPTGANEPCGSTTTFCAQNKIVQAYAWYAKQTHAAWPTRPLIWLIEGDFIQLAASSQVASLTSRTGAAAQVSWAQLGQLAALIASAIKTNMPNAIVAFDDSTWISDTERPAYWQAIAQAGTNYDMVWTTGVGNNPPFLTSGQTADSYNGKTGTYSWLHTFTGKMILVDESAGASQAGDTWSNLPDSVLNSQIADGVVAVNVSAMPSDYQSNVVAVSPQLNSTCP